MLETLDATAVRRWCAGALAALKRHQGEIDSLNVYPVPDGDTGTNLVLTLTSAQQALAMDLDTSPEGGDSSPHGHALRLMARGALLGARGNSGVILAQFLRGLADVLCAVPTVRGRELTEALRGAATAAYAAVAQPVEGTLLSVAAAAAGAAEQAASDDLGRVADAAATGAAQALERTTGQLPALTNAGVVDAGGRGFCLLLDALVEVVSGAAPARPAPEPPTARRPESTVRETGSPEYAYEVQFLLDAEPAAVRLMRVTLADLGDSLVVVGDGPSTEESSTWNVHVHVNDIGAAVEAGVVAGRPYRISVTRFAGQPPARPVDQPPARPADQPPARPVDQPPARPADQPPARPADQPPARPASPSTVEPASPPPARAAVVVADGSGVAELFTAEGATVVPGRPSAAELLDAIRSTGATRVVVLPNAPQAQAAANAAAAEAESLGVRVSVVPTRSPVQALAALAVRDPARRFDDDVIAMAEAAGACRYGEICQAGRDALTVAGPCRNGDMLALVEGEVHLIGSELLDTCTALLDRMLGGGGELVTLLVGADAPDGLAEAARAHVVRRWPFVEVHVYPGGQPDHPLLVGVE